MFNSDNPIKLRTEDLLERDSFCKHLARSILRYQDEETLTIGLLGKWGSGKTSIINLTIQHIENDFLDNPEKAPLIIKFNPWNFSDQNNLIFQFFRVLSTNLKRKEYGKALNKAGEIIEEYSDYLEPVTFSLAGIPGISKITKSIGKSIRDFGDKKSKDLDKLKDVIIKKLVLSNKKIIVIIDDIDRLSNSEIKQIFQLAKSLADFPNVIYILSFDKEIVCEALMEVQKGDGSEFIEKIIQVPIEVPITQKSEIYNLLFKELNKILKDVPEEYFDNNYWGNVFNLGIDKCFKNIRDVKRFLNIFNFGFLSIKDDVNPVDFIAITVIQVFYPDLYEQIKENKKLFVAEVVKFLDISTYNENSDVVSDYEIILKVLPEQSREDFYKLLKRMFPKIDIFEKKKKFHYTDESMNEWLLKKRICHPDKFDLYFRISLGKNEVSDKTIDQLLNENENFGKELQKFIESGSISFLLSSIYARLQSINSDKQKTILNFLLDKGDLIIKDQLITRILLQNIVIKYENKDELFKDLEEFILNSENGLFTCVSLVDFIGLQHSRDIPMSEADRILNIDKVKELENITAKKIDEFANKDEFFSVYKLPEVIFRWKRFGGEQQLNSFLVKVKSDNRLIVKFINAFTYPIKSFASEDIVPKIINDIYYDDLIKLLNREETFNKLVEIKESELYVSLTNSEKESIRLFIRNYEGKVGRNFSSN